MTNYSQEKKYLEEELLVFDKSILDGIISKKRIYVSLGDESNSNYCWYLENVYHIKEKYIFAFNLVKDENYEEAWKLLDEVDTDISFICENFDLEKDDPFGLKKLRKQIHCIQLLFPYVFFLSRESIIEEESCSICGTKNGLRNHCSHIPGKLYMGELCIMNVSRIKLKGYAIVRDPFDKYAFLKIKDREYDYYLLKHLMLNIRGPYDYFTVETHKEKLPIFQGVGRNDACPCGSGLKYKKCCLMSGNDMYDFKKMLFTHQPVEKKLTSIIGIDKSIYYSK